MSNMLRMPGLATGMDTDATIKQLMKPYNMKVDKMKQEKQNMQWKQEIMRDMIKELRGLKNDYFNIDSPDATNMVKASSFSVANITSSNEGVLTATAMPGAVNIPRSVSVEQVAKGAKINAKLTAAPGEVMSLSSKMTKLGFTEGEEIVLKYGEGDKEQTFSVTVGKDDTLQTFINNINSAKSNGSGAALYEKVQISFSELTGSLNIQTRNAGSSEILNIETNPTTDLKTRFSIDSSRTTGTDTKVKIIPNGGTMADAVTKIMSSNDFAIDNVRYTINPNYVVDASTQNITLTSKADAQKSVDKIKGFVDKYNAIVDKIYAKYSEKKQYKFLPLTEEQKKDMKDDEIKKWETKAKEGLVKSDEALGSMLSAMRNALFTPVEGAGISLKDIGLDSYSGIESTTKPGQIKIVDATKLKAALETRGDQVMNLFSGTANKSITDDNSIDPTTKAKKIYDNTGVFKRLNDILNNYVGKSDAILLKKVGIEGTLSSFKNDLTEKMQKKDEAIYQMERKMSVQEERYYKKFAQLEKAMNALNSQSNWLTSQLGGGK